MTKENRAEGRVCPDCGTHPIVRENSDLFCDICNRYLRRALRYPLDNSE